MDRYRLEARPGYTHPALCERGPWVAAEDALAVEEELFVANGMREALAAERDAALARVKELEEGREKLLLRIEAVDDFNLARLLAEYGYRFESAADSPSHWLKARLERLADLEEREALLVQRVKFLEEESTAVYRTASEAYQAAGAPPLGLAEWLKRCLLRLVELEKALRPGEIFVVPKGSLTKDLLQLARDFGYGGEDGVGLWAWFRDRLQERTRFRARLDHLSEQMRKP